MNNDIYECETDPNPELTDKVIGILAITGAVAISGLVLYGVGRIVYKINEIIVNKIGDKILGSTEET